jgi:integrase/recombinase XerD
VSKDVDRYQPGGVDNSNYQPASGRGPEPQDCASARGTLETIYADDLPKIASLWLMSYKSAHTRRSYAKSFTRWAEYLDDLHPPVHPLEALRPHADGYMRELENGRQDEDNPDNDRPPLATASVAHHLAAASSFYRYALSLEVTERNPFAAVNRPNVDPDYSATEGLTESQTASLLTAARVSSARAYALIVLLYTTGVRINGALAADIEDLGIDGEHHILTIIRKGGTPAKIPLPELTLAALTAYLDGRTTGPIFITSTGQRMGQTEAWKCLRRVAKRAGLPQAGSIHPHVLRHGFITDALEHGVPLHKVQDAAGHKDPRTTRRYDTARNQLKGHAAYKVAEAIAEKLEKNEEN